MTHAKQPGYHGNDVHRGILVQGCRGHLRERLERSTAKLVRGVLAHLQQRRTQLRVEWNRVNVKLNALSSTI